MSDSTENLNVSISSGSEGHKSSSAGDAVKKHSDDLNHTKSNSAHKNHSSGSPLKKQSHISSNSHHSNSVSKSKDHHSSPRPRDPNAIKKSHHDSSKLKEGHPPKDGSPKPKDITNSSSSSKSNPKDGSHSSSKPKHSSSSSSKPKDGSHGAVKPRPSSGSTSSSGKDRPRDGISKPLKPKDPNAKPKVSSSSDGSKHSSSAHKSSSSSHHKSSSSKPKDPSIKPKDHSQKPRDPSSKPKDSSSKPKDSSSKPKDLSSKPKESSSKSKDPSIKPKHSSSSSSKPGHSSSKHKSSSDGSKVKKEGGDRIKVKTEHGQVKTETGLVKTEPGQVKTEPLSPSKIRHESRENKPSVEEAESVKVKEEITEKSIKKRPLEEDEEDEPLSSKNNKVKKQKVDDKRIVKEESKKRKKEPKESEDDDEPLVKKKKGKKDKKADKKKKKKGKDGKEEPEVWKWWEEEPLPDGIKWRFLEHKGPVFAPPYEPLPNEVHFKYNGSTMKLSLAAEEVAGFYARMLDHDYTTKEVFNRNFFNDWTQEMTPEERAKITDLNKCNFKQLHKYYLQKSEERRNLSKEEKLKNKNANAELAEEYGFCIMDHHKEKIGNFKIEPPGLFRGRGDHPKMGKLKKRLVPKDVIINCSKDAVVPEPPKGTRWKKVIHDNKVSWLSTWTENVQGQNKYIMLNPSSRLKGEKDWQKYEIARKLKNIIGKIRANYHEDFKSKEMRVRQRAVAMYFIDKLALRAGNEKEEGESADTVGCCSLRVEHIKLYDEKDGKEFVAEFDFLGKDSIRYLNSVPVEKRVYKNLRLFVENKAGSDDLFDRLNTSILNQHLRDLMENLTAKVFRTYNASFTLQNQLNELTKEEDSVVAKELAYNRANRAVAILCNHQRAAPKTFDKQMENLQEKIEKKYEDIKKAKKEYKALKAEYKSGRNAKIRDALERKKKQVERLEEQLTKLDIKSTDKQENKEIALGTSKLNYLDPRISVAWTKKYEVPLEKVYNKTQREKFRWAIDMAGADFVF